MSDFKVGDRVIIANSNSNYYLKKGVIDNIFSYTTKWPYFILFDDGSSASFSKYDLLRDPNYQPQEPNGPVAHTNTKTLGEILREKLNTNEALKEYENQGNMVVNDKGGMKADGGKIDYTYLLKDLPVSVDEVTKVLMYGAKKYNRSNYAKVESERYHAAMSRHIMAYLRGEKNDPETGYHHLAHAVCCLMFLIEREVKED